MRKLLSLTMAWGLAHASLFAQVLDVASVQKVDLPETAPPVLAAISPQADYLLLTQPDNRSLVRYQLNTGQIDTVSDAPGAGYAPQLTADGGTIVFRTTTYADGVRRLTGLSQHHVGTRRTTTLLQPTRRLQGLAVRGQAMTAIEGGRPRRKALGEKAVANETPVLSIDNRQLMITRGTDTRVLSPNGTQASYIWPSLSPDGRQVLYYMCGRGAYVCDLDGQHPRYLGHYTAPRWYNDQVVVAMDDHDDGQRITASSIVAIGLDGQVQTLTPDTLVATYPQAAGEKGVIAFSTPEGDTYLIRVNTTTNTH